MNYSLQCFATPLTATRISASTFLRQLCFKHGPSFLATDETRIARHARLAWTPQKIRSPPPVTAEMESTTVMATKMDGKATAATIRAEIGHAVRNIVSQRGESCRPGLAVVIVGERRDSQTYVHSKRKACEEVGIRSFGFELPADCTQEALQDVVDELNARDDVHGILVQLPLPDHIDDELILDRISLKKDVDGFHPLNIGRLCLSGRAPPLFAPCTPKGCIELLDRYGVQIEGKNAVIVGRSNIVGLPVSMLLLHRNATVTICHSRTTDTEEKVRGADIIVAACGIANYIKPEWLKPGVVIVDVGINAVDDPTKKKGYRLVGDVDYDGASEIASFITPVPGGIGPMTIAMLLSNTLDACRRQISDK